MKNLTSRLIVFLLLLSTRRAAADPVEVCFVPGGDCAGVVVREVSAAQKTIFVQAYSFTSRPIIQALVAAKTRGVDVEIILDVSNVGAKYSGLASVQAAEIPTTIDKSHAIAHNKIMIIDGVVVITGSFNFTTSAQKHNAENLVILRGADIAAKYAANWKIHRAHAVSP